MDFGVRHAARVIEVDLEVVALFLERTADVSDHSHCKRPESVLPFVELSEQRDPRVALIPLRFLATWKPLRYFFMRYSLSSSSGSPFTRSHDSTHFRVLGSIVSSTCRSRFRPFIMKRRAYHLS